MFLDNVKISPYWGIKGKKYPSPPEKGGDKHSPEGWTR